MNKIILVGMCISLVLLSGCMNKYYAFDFNSTSNAECSIKCEDLMNKYYCWEALPSYQSSFTNGEQTKGLCSCYIRVCR